jgi:hypothetical protein
MKCGRRQPPKSADRWEAKVLGDIDRYAIPMMEIAGRRAGAYCTDHEANPWMEDDKAWFEEHPQRTHRLRRAYPDETAQGEAGAP